MMSEKNIIVHFIARDKFTAGYIEFMKICFPEYEHHFFTRSFGFPIRKLYDEENIHYYRHTSGIFMRLHNVQLLRKSKKIIISGGLLWFSNVIMILSGLISKTYLHFWGGDFYSFRGTNYSLIHPKIALKRFVKDISIRKCAGTINLIEPDIEKLCEIFPNNTKHFVAPMGGSPLIKIDFEAIRMKPHNTDKIRISVGNSAFPENQHIDAFRALGHLKNENIEIISSLSYGLDDYREKVIEEGKRIFGDKFTPILDYMSYEDYIKLLSSCDIGVFNNNRQQGMGNISLLLRLGKKVYLREDTAMWKHYGHNMKYIVYPVSELESITLEELVKFPSELAYNNIQIAEEHAASNYAIEQWRKVFED